MRSEIGVFSGIIEHVGRVLDVSRTAQATRMTLDLGPLADDLPTGASVAVNGVCLTLAEPPRGTACGFDAVPETLRVTTLGGLARGAEVNLERSLRVGQRIDGHFVQGHVDGVGTLERIGRDGGEYKLHIRVQPGLSAFIVRKGSVAVDGASMTVVDADPGRFSIVLVPTTLSKSTLGQRRVGDRLNIETDILARLVAHQMAALIGRADARPAYAARDVGAAGQAGGVTLELLRSSGYVA